MRHALFIHGGPGFNSNAESNLLPKLFLNKSIQLHFWNEPSAKRPCRDKFQREKAYANWLLSGEKSLEKLYRIHGKIVLIAQSFGAHLAAYLGHYHSDKIEKIIIVNSALNQRATDRNILSFTMNDFMKTAPEKAERMRQILDNYTGEFSDEVLDGFFMAASNPEFPLHYWKDLEKMNQYYQHGTGKWEFDVESFVAVKKDYVAWDESKIVDIPTVAYFSEQDKVTKFDEQLPKIRQVFSNLEVINVKGTGHFLQIESPESIMNGILKEFDICQNQI